MPIYEYRCNACNTVFEKLVPRVTDQTFECPLCNSDKTSKLMSTIGIASGSFKEPACTSNCSSASSSCCSGGGCHHRNA